jgi:transcriptional regulator with XRE-family HTH domain
VCDVSIQNSIDSFLNEFESFLSKQKITVTSAAEEIGITRSHLSKVIHKRTSPSVELLEKMDSFLKQGEH